MFLLRGILTSLSVFVLAYVMASAVVALAWRPVARRTANWTAPAVARLLFTIRCLPAFLSAAMTVGLAVPSFLRFEPRSISESIGVVPVLLTLVFVVLLAVGASRTTRALWRTREAVARWTGNETTYRGVRVVTSFSASPPIALTGICRSRLVLSSVAVSALTERELGKAIDHELAHLRGRDNLKKLLLQAFAFPGMRPLERAWADAAELSADAESVHSQQEALELASALVKVSQLHTVADLPAIASGLVDGPAALLQKRVTCLLQWQAPAASRSITRAAIPIALLGATILVAGYPGLLRLAHAFTEALVR